MIRFVVTSSILLIPLVVSTGATLSAGQDDLRERVEKLKRKAAELVEEGRREAAEEIRQEVRRLAESIEEALATARM